MQYKLEPVQTIMDIATIVLENGQYNLEFKKFYLEVI